MTGPWFVPTKSRTTLETFEAAIQGRPEAMECYLMTVEQSVYTAGVFAERFLGLDCERAGVGEIDGEDFGHAGRARGHHRALGAQEHRLLNAVSDEDDGLAVLRPYPQQFQVHLLAGQRVERAERLVHQDQLGVVDQGAGDRRALLHAAGQLVGVFVLRALEPDHVQQFQPALAARLRRQTQDFGRQQHVLEDAPPLQQQRLLEHHADIAPGIEGVLAAADPDLAAVMAMQAREQLEHGGLAAAGRPDQRDEFARLDVETHVGDRKKLLAPRAVDLADAVQADERLAHSGPVGRRAIRPS